MAKLVAKERTVSGTRASRCLRKEGLIPGVIYGHGQATESITLSEHDMEVALLHGARVLEIEISGNVQSVLVKDVQWDVFGQEVLHVDLARVDLDELITMSIAVTLRGTPVGAKDGGVLRQLATEVTVECKVRDIPDELRVVINDLNIDDKLLLSDIELPEGVTLQDDPGNMLCVLELVEDEVEADPLEEGEEPAGPEVIGEKKSDDEDDE